MAAPALGQACPRSVTRSRRATLPACLLFCGRRGYHTFFAFILHDSESVPLPRQQRGRPSPHGTAPLRLRALHPPGAWRCNAHRLCRKTSMLRAEKKTRRDAALTILSRPGGQKSADMSSKRPNIPAAPGPVRTKPLAAPTTSRYEGFEPGAGNGPRTREDALGR